MEKNRNPLLRVLLIAGTALYILDGNTAEAEEQHGQQVKNLTSQLLPTIPTSNNNSNVTTLILNGNLLSLNESDRLALVSYTGLTQLYLDNNQVMDIGAKCFTVVPQLQVLSLSGNNISRLDPEAFSGLDDLQELYLSNNLLTTVSTELLQGLKNLKVLKIEGNPWNCSCELLQRFRDAQGKAISYAASNAMCTTPENLAGSDIIQSKCESAPTTTTTTTTNSPKTTTTSTLKPMLTAHVNHSISQDQTPVLGNSWKFTVSVAALGLTTAVLIVCAIKGPSWYKLFHNYRHRRLRDRDDSERVGTTVFHQTPRHQQTFTFESGGHRRKTEEEEDEDGYFEDPYIRREE